MLIPGHFHLSEFHGISESHPFFPEHPANCTAVETAQVPAVQIRKGTPMVPPGALTQVGAVSICKFVVVLVLRAKHSPVVVGQRVICK